MLSKHIVGLAHGEILVTGDAIVNTELLDMDDCVASLGENPTAANAIVSVTKETQNSGERAKIKIKVTAVDGTTAGNAATLCRWMASGR